MPTAPITDFDRVVRTVCSPNCMGTCGVNGFVKDGRIVKLEPAPMPDRRFDRICLKGIAMATERLHHPDRLQYPLIRTGERGAGQWRRASWDEAYNYIIERMLKIAGEQGWRSLGWFVGSGNYGLHCKTAPHRVANFLGGTYFPDTGLSSDWAGMTAFLAALGDPTGSNEISDIARAKYILNVGKNAADTGHSEMHFVFDAMEAGAKLIVIDPRFSRTAAKAHEWVSPRPATDTALALGMIHVVITERLFRDAYVRRHTNLPYLVHPDSGKLLRERDLRQDGSDAFLVWDSASEGIARAGDAVEPRLSGSCTICDEDGREHICETAFDVSWEVWRQYSPEVCGSICGISPDCIRRLAREYSAADPAWIWLGLGPQRYSQGHLVYRAFVTLAALCGNIGKPFAGVNTIDGPIVAAFKSAPHDWMRPDGHTGHLIPGTRMLQTILTEDPYPIRSLWISASGMSTQTPLFKRFVSDALPKLDLFVVTEQVMTEAAAYADVVLPCVSYFEDDWDLVPNGENWYMQLRRRVVDPVGESQNDSAIFAGLCNRLQPDNVYWKRPQRDSCQAYLTEHPDPRFRAIDWNTLEREGVAEIPLERPYVPFGDMRFQTPSGRIELYQEQFLDLNEAVLSFREPTESKRSSRYPLNIITYKHVHSTHSQHVILPLIREVLPHPKLEISAADAASRDIADGDVVTVFNDRGSFEVRACVSSTVPTGTLAIPQGWWRRHFVAGHPNDLAHLPVSASQERAGESNWAAWDVLCDVRKSAPA